MTNVLRRFVDRTCKVFLDDILVYSEDKEEHSCHVRKVIEALQEAHCAIKAEKCRFHAKELDFFGYILSSNGIDWDSAKIKAVFKWKEPNNVTELQSLPGLGNFLRRFIKGYSEIAVPLTELTQIDVLWN
jgi:hypothetical protein